MTLTPRPSIQNLGHTAHGALNYAELEAMGISPDEIIDFSVNINPFGASPAVKAAIEQTSFEEYPDRDSLALRRALASHLKVSIEEILPGNGSAELLWFAAFAYLRPGDQVLLIAPTFGEYGRVSRMMGATVNRYHADPKHHFAVDPQAVSQLLQDNQYRMVFLCNPNNPTGQRLPLDAISSWAQITPRTLFIVDEAYLAFVPNAESALQLELENILIIRSMTKDYALAGLRLGYALGAPNLIQALKSVRPPWHINAMAQAAGLAALQDDEYLHKTLARVHVHKTALQANLKALGCTVIPSETHFFLVQVGDAKSFRARLLQEGIQVRDCTSFGLPEHIRIATRLPEENDRLLKALRKIS